MAKYDRVTTGTTRVINSIDTLLSKSTIKLGGKNSQGQDYISVTSTEKG